MSHEVAEASPLQIRPSWRGWLAWGIVSLFYLYEFLIRVAPTTMEPELEKSYHLSAAGLGAVLGAYYYIYAPLQLVVGGFLDQFGSRRVLVPAILICAAGSFLEASGVAGSGFLLLGRLMQGFGSAFAFVGAMHVAATWFPSSKLALLSGLTTALGMVGAVVGNAAVAQVTVGLGWQVSLWDAGIVGVAIGVTMLLFLPRRKLPDPVGEERSATLEPQKPLQAVCMALRDVMRNPQTWIIGFVASCLYLPLSLFAGLWGVPFLEHRMGMDVVDASDAVSMIYVGWLVGGPFGGWLSDRVARRKLLLVLSVILTFLVSLLVIFLPVTEEWVVYAVVFLFGLVSSLECIAFAAGLEANDVRVGGTSIAVVNMMVMLVGGLVQPVSGWLIDLGVPSAEIAAGAYETSDFRRALLLMPAMLVVAFMASFFMRETFRRPGEEGALEVGEKT